jgi:hypothetical protein
MVLGFISLSGRLPSSIVGHNGRNHRVAASVPVGPADLSDLQDDRTDNPAQDEDGAGEVVPDNVDERVVHFKELLPSQIISCCPKMKM